MLHALDVLVDGVFIESEVTQQAREHLVAFDDILC